MNTMMYRGYAARIAYSEDDGCFVGHVAGIKDVVGFHGESVTEIRGAFEEAVDDYLQTCEKLNRSPQKPFSGNLMLRIPPEVHAGIAMAAEVSGKSINQWATETFADALQTNVR
jgi:predicted HicB family RNase H-like nuclease